MAASGQAVSDPGLGLNYAMVVHGEQRFVYTRPIVAGDELTVDYTDIAPQAKGPINLRPSMVEACVFYSLIGCLGPNLHFNDGMRDVVRLKFALVGPLGQRPGLSAGGARHRPRTARRHRQRDQFRDGHGHRANQLCSEFATPTCPEAR